MRMRTLAAVGGFLTAILAVASSPGGGREPVAQMFGIESIEVLSEEIDGNRATVNVRMIFGNGAEDEEGHDFVRVDGRWKIAID